ncbi:VanZ family protein [Candidatus Bathyarchaeota archaeon]|nr:VanZ family protein [Candidatus Bathyarchaeota archaeon]
MGKVLAVINKWGPFLFVIVLIFIFSNIPKNKMPDLAQGDLILKKGGHMLGYCLLALTFWYGLRWDKKRWWLAWLVAVLYAITDEFHQSFIPGRTPLLGDVAIDSFAAGLGVWVRYVLMRFKEARKII